MRIFILTQEDAFYIPRLLDLLFARKPGECEVVGAAILKGEIAAKNVGVYFRFLGFAGFLEQGVHFARYKLMDVADRIVRLRRSYSVRGALRKHRVPTLDPASVNDAAFHRQLRQMGVDLIVSIACPQVLKKALLDLPPRGVINIHGALLPKYRGLLPSFWVLANGETETGVTVHYMNEKLDDGPIIVQKRVPIREDDTLHSLVMRSKVEYGADALAEALRQIMSGEVNAKANDSRLATYYPFPTPEAIARFREKGRRVR
jgi:methionyl-tRNA formyltransferase